MSLEFTSSPGTQRIHGQRLQVKRRSAETQQIAESSSQVVSIFLAMIAASVYSVVAADDDFSWSSVLWLAVLFGFVTLGAWFVRRLAVRSGHTPIIAPVIVIVGLLALAWESYSRIFLQAGLPFELLTMSVIRNLILALAVVSVWPSYQRLCVGLSLFLAMFGIIASHDVAVQWLAGIFAVGAVGWLVVSHWENLRRRLHGREQAYRSRSALLIPLLLISLLGVGLGSTDRQVSTALRGFLPSSGGSGKSDPYARDGSGNGEMLVAGTNQIQSFAPIDDAPFMQDDKPSLYDLFDDTYEEELKITKSDRAISLPADLANRAKDHLHNRTEKANREFSTLRQPRDQSGKHSAKDILSDALFYVAGRVPLHLRLQVYDLFDGVNWYPEEEDSFNPFLKITQSGGKPWLKLSDRVAAREFLGQAETHALKIVNLDSNTIPAPLYLHGVHIDLVDRADMYAHRPGGLVAMNRERLPALVPIHLATRTVDQRRLASDEKFFLRLQDASPSSVIPETIDRFKLKDLAQRWSVHAEAGWGQISAIAHHLRSEYILDTEWRPSGKGKAPVEEFLFEARRGPDYQFATAASLLLRSVGYQTRVVSGFYADPTQYDRSSRHTPVLAKDIHFWTEVHLGGGDWLTVEATPGYEVLAPLPSLFQRMWKFIQTVVSWPFQNWLLSVLGMSIFVMVLQFRHRLLNSLYTLRWRFELWWAPQHQLASTLALLRKRADLSHTTPSSSTTHHRWLGEMMARTNDVEIARSLYQLRALVDAAAYSGGPHVRTEKSTRVCQYCERGCTLRWFQADFANRSKCNDRDSNFFSDRMRHAEYARATNHEY